MEKAPNQKLAHRKAEQAFIRASLTVSEAARICNMSINTVKKVVYEQNGHPNSAIRLQRGLEDYIEKKQKSQDDAVSVVLTNHGAQDALELIKKLMDVLKDTALLEADDPRRFKVEELKQAERLLNACGAMLPAAAT